MQRKFSLFRQNVRAAYRNEAMPEKRLRLVMGLVLTLFLGTFGYVESVPAESCSPGTYSNDGMTPCAPCPIGTFAASSGSTECTPCRVGTFQDDPGQTSCTDCLAGTFAASSGSAACTACRAGTFAASSGSTECTFCETGTFQDDPGQAACTSCPTGTFAASPGSTACSPCPTGTFASFSGSAACSPCTANFFQDQAGATACKPCLTGTVQPASGQSSCLALDFKCWATKNIGPKFAVIEGVQFDDQFATGNTKLLRPARFCSSADTGVADSDSGVSLCCYDTSSGALQPRAHIAITDQFGTLQLEIGTAKPQLCVPCSMTVQP